MHKKLALPLRKFFRNYVTAVEKYKLVLVRNGESEYNKNDLFTGWFDTRLSAKGKADAKVAGQTLLMKGYKFNIAFTSVLTRAQQTLSIILQENHQTDLILSARSSWRLNERHCGELTGLSKAEASVKYGSKTVWKWRRGFSSIPPVMQPSHKHYDSIRADTRYADQDIGEFPLAESLKMTAERTLPYWHDVIIPKIKAGKNVIIVAHASSLRSLVKELDQMSDIEIVSINIPTGIPIVYKLDKNCKPIPYGSLLYLGDPVMIKKAMRRVAWAPKEKSRY